MRLIDADLLELEYTMSKSKDNHRTLAASLVHTQEHQHIIHLLKKAPTVVNAVSEERCREIANEMIPQFVRQARADAIKEFADKISQLLERYSNVHKHADEARNDTDEYPDGTKSEMTSVWEVQSLTKHGMADYETMAELQENIEYIAQDRLLSELEKDFRLLIREMGGVSLVRKP